MSKSGESTALNARNRLAVILRWQRDKVPSPSKNLGKQTGSFIVYILRELCSLRYDGFAAHSETMSPDVINSACCAEVHSAVINFVSG